MLLTSRIVRAARPRERRYVLADEHGMSLHVMPWGSKWWRFRYRFQHAERMISLGVYPGVNLATARLLHADARGLLARDIDPGADRKERRAASAHTFEVVARQWFKLLQPRVAKVSWPPTRSKMQRESWSATSFRPWELAQSGVHFTEDSQPHYTRHTFARRRHRGKRSPPQSLILPPPGSAPRSLHARDPRTDAFHTQGA